MTQQLKRPSPSPRKLSYDEFLEWDGVYRSSVIRQLWIRVDWLWQTPLPTEFSIFRPWGLMS
jgi:hypothetical protein